MIRRMVVHGYGKRAVCYDKALAYMPYAQCGVCFEDNKVYFISYTTIVIVLDGEWLECTGTYSPTTRKQIGRFLKEYAPDISYHMVKAIAGTGARLNTMTGEIVE